jgi:choline/glycine/proline betaine transport protein
MPDWRLKLGGFLHQTEKAKQETQGVELTRFVAETVIPAFEEVAEEMRKHGREATIGNAGTSATLSVHHNGEEELTYRVQTRIFPNRVSPYAEIRFRERKGRRLIRVESMFRYDVEYSLVDIAREEISQHIIDNYVRRVETA